MTSIHFPDDMHFCYLKNLYSTVFYAVYTQSAYFSMNISSISCVGFQKIESVNVKGLQSILDLSKNEKPRFSSYFLTIILSFMFVDYNVVNK